MRTRDYNVFSIFKSESPFFFFGAAALLAPGCACWTIDFPDGDDESLRDRFFKFGARSVRGFEEESFSVGFGAEAEDPASNFFAPEIVDIIWFVWG